MSSTSAANLQKKSGQSLISTAGWVWIGVLGALFGAYFFGFFKWMTLEVLDDRNGNWTHAALIPLLSLYFIQHNRERLGQLPQRVCGLGLVLLFLGLFGYALAIYPFSYGTLKGYAMVLALTGLVLFLVGPARMRLLWFPIAYLAMGIKIPENYLDYITVPLRGIAARGATVMLNVIGPLFGIRAERSGSTIDLFQGIEKLSPPMDVAQACSGLHMVVAFLALGLAMAYLYPRPWWHRLITVFMAFPIAVLINVGRIVTLAIVRVTLNAEMATGDTHKFIGLLMLAPAAGLFWLAGWVLDRIARERPGDEPAALDPAAPPSDAAPLHDQGQALWIGRSVAVGVLLAALVGSSAALALGSYLASVRPDMLGAWARPSLAIVLLVAVVAGLIWCCRFLGKSLPRTTDTAAGHPSPAGARRPLAAPALAAGVLLVAWGSLTYVVRATEVVLFKEELPLRQSFQSLPDRMGSWILDLTQGRHGEIPIADDVVAEMGTKVYLLRVYDDFTARDGAPGSRLTLQLAYYTGTVDQVPHIPERCYVAGGRQPVGGKSIPTLHPDSPAWRLEDGTWTAASRKSLGGRGGEPLTVRLPFADAKDKAIEASAFSFHEPGRPDLQSTVIYFFAANGRYVATSKGVRFRFGVRDRYAYYAKIELLFPGVGDKQKAAERASAFLSTALPEIMACLPDWVEVQQGRYPTKKDAGRNAD